VAARAAYDLATGTRATTTPKQVYGEARRGLRTRVADSVSARSRRRRIELYHRLMRPRAGEEIVDIGCGDTGLAALEPEARVTGVDLTDRPGFAGGPDRFVQADGRKLPFPDGRFDIAYSTSLIEHIPPADRPQVVAEVRRVSRRYFVQTPNRWFPVEPHILLPFFQHLPYGARRRLWGLGVSKDPFEDIRLLGPGEIRALFPDGVFVRERVGPLTKSLVIAGPAEEVERPTRRRGRGRRPGSS
jgi:SAM-dependent methyltransferase